MATASEANFTRSIQESVYGLWSGRIDMDLFIDQMNTTLNLGYRDAWYEGAKQCGVMPDELTANEILEIRSEVVKDYGFIFGFAEHIEQNSRANGKLLRTLAPRANLWKNRYTAVRDRAMTLACGDQKLKWIRHASDSCVTCLALDGKVYRASVWRANDVRPQHPSKLACMRGAGGVPVCRCEFAVTDEPVTPGSFPRI